MSEFKKLIEKKSPVLGFLTATIILLGSVLTAVNVLLPLYLKQGNKIILPAVIIIIGVILSWILILLIFKIITYLDERDVLKYFLYKCKEFIILVTSKKIIDLPFDVKYDCANFYKYFKNRLDIIRNFACINQGEIAQFYYLAGTKHKTLKTMVNSSCNDKNKLKQECEELRKQIYLMMTGNNKVFDKCCCKIDEYFSGRHKENPRICIKVYEENEGIFDFYRYGDKKRNKTSRFDDNTAYLQIRKKGKFYLCNNIPEFVGKEKYFNQRLDGEAVREFQRNNGEISDHGTWCRFWKPYDSEVNDGGIISKESCYMSTLVIPMTLFDNKDLNTKFREKFVGAEKQTYTDEERQRFIYGFLCLDHIEKDYFNEELDYRVNYIFADMLSIYLIAYYMYTDYSDTFITAKNKIKEAC